MVYYCLPYIYILVVNIHTSKSKVSNVSEERQRERITIRLTQRYMELLNELIERGAYNSRNEAIRDALRLLFEHHGLRVLKEQGETLR